MCEAELNGGVDRELLNLHPFGSVGDGGGRGVLDENDCRTIFGALWSLHLFFHSFDSSLLLRVDFIYTPILLYLTIVWIC